MRHQRTVVRLGLAGVLVTSLAMATPAFGHPSAGSPRAQTASSGSAADGRIAFASNDCQLYTINPDGTALEQVTNFESECADAPAWSPDGSRLAFTLLTDGFSQSGIYTSNPDGSDLTSVAEDGPGYYDLAPDYTPDGQRLVYARCLPDPPGGCAIYSIRSDGTDRQALTTYRHGVRAGTDVRPQVSPDGRWLTFTRFGSVGVQAQVWLMPMDRSERAHPITPVRLAGRSAKWSPDSRTVDFAGGGPTGYGFHVYTSAVTPPLRRTQLTNLAWPNGDISPAPSPSGHLTTFISDRRYPDACCNELFVMHADGSHQHLVTGDLIANVPDWGTAPIHQGKSERVAPPSAASLARAARAQAVLDRVEGVPSPGRP